MPGTKKDAARAMVSKVDGERAGGNAMRLIEERLIEVKKQQRRWASRASNTDPQSGRVLTFESRQLLLLSSLPFAFNFTLPTFPGTVVSSSYKKKGLRANRFLTSSPATFLLNIQSMKELWAAHPQCEAV